MPWYAIRTVYDFGSKSSGMNVFEERIVCFHASSSDAAHEKAAAESREYERVNGARAHPDRVGYEQYGQSLVDGYELWSELFESTEPLEEVYAHRYSQYEYVPES